MYPTYVNFVASTSKKGDLVSFASLRAISVFPLPVDPEIKIFLGMISSLILYGNNFLLHLFLKETATAFLA